MIARLALLTVFFYSLVLLIACTEEDPCGGGHRWLVTLTGDVQMLDLEDADTISISRFHLTLDLESGFFKEVNGYRKPSYGKVYACTPALPEVVDTLNRIVVISSDSVISLDYISTAIIGYLDIDSFNKSSDKNRKLMSRNHPIQLFSSSRTSDTITSSFLIKFFVSGGTLDSFEFETPTFTFIP